MYHPKNMAKKYFISLVLFACLFAGQARAINQAGTAGNLPEDEAEIYEYEYVEDLGYAPEIYDPIEGVNRAIFEFNHVVDGMLLKPVAQVYRGVVPEWGRQRVSNVLYNLGEPVTVVNSIFQGDDVNAFTSFWRFVINSTFGVLGIFDAASEVGLKPRREDFGQTLYVWGADESPYLVLPLLGPSTLRDGTGLVVDYFIDPFNYEDVLKDSEQVIHTVAEVVDSRTTLLPVTDHVEKTSLDPYAAYRSLYLQKRRSVAFNEE